MTKPLVSIIIPTFNSEKRIKTCLDSLNDSDYPNFETIIVDNDSQDSTQEICSQYPVLFIAYSGNVSEARNHGIHNSKGIYLLFLDSDQTISPNLISDCVEISSDSVNMVTIPEKSNQSGILGAIFSFEKQVVHLSGTEIPRFYEKTLVTAVGCLNSLLRFGEDWDLFQKALSYGGILGRTNEMISHYEEENLLSLLQKTRMYGRFAPVTFQGTRSEYRSRFLGVPKFRKVCSLIVLNPLLGLGYLFLRLLKGVFFILGYLESQIGSSNQE